MTPHEQNRPLPTVCQPATNGLPTDSDPLATHSPLYPPSVGTRSQALERPDRFPRSIEPIASPSAPRKFLNLPGERNASHHNPKPHRCLCALP